MADTERQIAKFEVSDLIDEVEYKFKNLSLTKEQRDALDKYLEQLKEVEKTYADENNKIEDINNSIKEANKALREYNRLLEQSSKTHKKIRKNIKDSIDNFSKATTLYDAASKFSGELLTSWEAADKAASSFARHLGGSVFAMNELRKNAIYFSDLNKIGIRFNKSIEDLINLQSKYSDEIGRTISMSNAQRETMAAMDAVMGDAGTKLAANLEKFGIGYEEAGRRAGKLFAEASKYGINFAKLSGEVTSHLDLASRYTFVNGIKGLESMAMKAAALRLDMQQAAGFANKVNTVEGSATASATLSVLGGSFTNNANPLTMLYEGLNDLEGLQDRIVNMFGNLGKLNYQTGEVEIGAFDKQRIKAAAEATGLDYGKVLDMVQTKTRGDAIRTLTGGRWANDKEFEDLLANVATIEKGRAYVEIGGEKVDVANLDDSDKGELRKKAQGTSEDIKEIAENTRSLTDLKDGAKKQLDAAKARHAEQQNIGKIAKQSIDYLARSAVAIEAIRSFLWAMGGLGLAKSIHGVYPSGGSDSGKRVSGPSYFKPTQPLPTGGAPTGGGTGATSIPPAQVLSGGQLRYTPNQPIQGLGGTFVRNNLNNIGVANNTGANAAAIPGNNGTGQQNGNTVVPRNGNTVVPQGRSADGTKPKPTNRWVSTPKAQLGGMAASIGGQMLVGWGEREVASGNWEKSDASTILAKGAGNALAWGGMGAMIAGPYGAAIGALAGAAYGFGTAWYDGAKDDIIKKLASRGHYLNGDYSYSELKKILGGRTEISKDRDLLAKVIKNNDMPAFKEGGKIEGAFSGKVNGIGSGFDDVNIARVSNGEYVVNAGQTSKYEPLLKAINEDKVKVMPVPNSIQPMIAASTQQNRVAFNSENKLKINDFNINLGGTLKLDSNGKTTDLDLNNPVFKQQLTNILSRELNKIEFAGLNKENSYNKFG